MFIKLILFCIGAIIGSFLNAVIYRLPRRESLLFPGSHCPQCGEKIRWFDNIPILSFFLLGRKCRHCKLPIPVRYPIVEILSAVLFVIIYHVYGFNYEFFFYTTLSVLLLTVTFTDLEKGKIPNSVILLGVVLGLLMSLIFWPVRPPSWTGWPLNFTNSLIAFLVGGGIMIFWAAAGKLLFKKESLGAGDIKLVAMAGIFLGLQNTLLALFLSFLTATIAGISMILLKKARMDSRLPFAPFLASGALISLVYGNQICTWYFNIIR
ncbi:prepilin peptidase [bacterium]|nr:prepilin peptidase [bacterium]MBU1065155.1 prepilin peptidase [bacterium]MBU1634128.1 prepilin peptidase [bacterium]MBU1875397.1 prepilin peptidase [bacterium]